MHYPLISMQLKYEDWTTFRRTTRLQKCRMTKLWQFWQGHPKPAFSEKCKAWTKGIFLKIAQRVNLDWKAQKQSGANGIILYLVCN